jgi:hypothetical protein
MSQFIPRLEVLDGRTMPSAGVTVAGAGIDHVSAELRAEWPPPPPVSPFGGRVDPGGANGSVEPSITRSTGEEIPQT